jgi:hypothetical protein
MLSQNMQGNFIYIRCTQYHIMWKSLSVTCDRSVVFSGFLHLYNWRPWYNWNIVEIGVMVNMLAWSMVDSWFKGIEYTSPLVVFELSPLVVIGTDYTGSCKSNYQRSQPLQPQMLSIKWNEINYSFNHFLVVYFLIVHLFKFKLSGAVVVVIFGSWIYNYILACCVLKRMAEKASGGKDMILFDAFTEHAR